MCRIGSSVEIPTENGLFNKPLNPCAAKEFATFDLGGNALSQLDIAKHRGSLSKALVGSMVAKHGDDFGTEQLDEERVIGVNDK